jgi:hypothetical protein
VLVAHHTGAAVGEEPPAELPPMRPSREDPASEMNRVLDKISREGITSLTAAERRFLDDVSRRLRQE